MKKVIFVLLLCFLTFYLNGQEFYMYVGGQKRVFEVSATKMLVKSETLDATRIKNEMQRGNVKEVHQINNRGLSMVDLQNTNRENLLNVQKQWNSREDVTYTSPIFIDETGREIGGLTNQILIRLKSADDYSLLQKTIVNYPIKSIKQCDFDERHYLLTLHNGTAKNAMQIANELYLTDLFEYSEPNLIHFLEFATNDIHFQHQWGLHNTGQFLGISGVDIRVQQAWEITTGSPNIRIAVLDLGVDLNHPDLKPNLLEGFDATVEFSNIGDTYAGSYIGNIDNLSHGTACAGIIAARGNNSIGISGVAYNSKILPVRIATKIIGWNFTESDFIRRGIEWARENEADVISMSIGTNFTTAALDTAIQRAATLGRNNLGIVLVAASGNGNSSTIGFPANRPNVIAVGAVSQCGERKSPSSCDGEENWEGSNYGTNLDVVAPGVKVYTTGVLNCPTVNPDGIIAINNGADGVYFTNFNGTSAAAPHVAGIAALILSVRPDLTQAQVRHAIESTTRKIRTDLYTYSDITGRPNGTWNNQMGYGLVDAFAAVDLVVRISGPDAVCLGSTASFEIQNPPIEATVVWTVGPNLTTQNITQSTIVVKNEPLQLPAPTFPPTIPIDPEPMCPPMDPTPVSNSWIKAEVSVGGYVYTLRRDLAVDKPTISSIELPAPINTGQVRLVKAHHNGLSNQCVNWSVSPMTSVNINTGWLCNQMQVGFGIAGMYNVTATVQNACGTTTKTAPLVVTGFTPPPLCGHCPPPPFPCLLCGGGGIILPPELQSYPNPVCDVLTINLAPQTTETISALSATQTLSNVTYDIRLLNAQGFIVRQQKASSGKIEFNVANLPEGAYYLHIENNGKIEKHQIIVKRN